MKKHVRSQTIGSDTISDGVAWVRLRLQSLAATERDESMLGSPAKLVRAGPTLSADRVSPRPNMAAMAELARRMGLSRFEEDVLLFCAAAALDSSLPALCAAASGEVAKPYPTFSLAMRLFEEPAWEALTASCGLRHWRLIEIHQSASEPLITAALRADERIVEYLMGLNSIDDRVEARISNLRRVATGSVPESHEVISARIDSVLRTRNANQRIVQLLGPCAASKREVACEVARRLGLQLWRLPASAIAALGSEVEDFARLLVRECLLHDAALYFDAGGGSDVSDGSTVTSMVRMIERLDRVVIFLAIRDPLQDLARATIDEQVGKPTPSEQRAAWLQVTPAPSEGAAEILAGHFNLDIATIERVGTAVGREGSADAGPLLWRHVREAVQPRTTGLAERIDVRAAWDDLVLPEEQIRLLREMASQVRHQWVVYEQWGFARRLNRGLGIGALFCGESGTGKTMAAEVIAGAADLDLYRIDLASVVSKYVGETEKNLRRVFDAFDAGAAILFFDEADALFGKRSEVKDSHDRYANIEINYLLQRMESYRGLVILATNRRSGLDPAFMRRLRFIVNFPYPAAAERALIWRKVFPAATPQDALDFDRLALLGLSGGNIQTVALNAAFSAASERRAVGMDLILASARAEMMKLDLPFNDADFRWDGEIRRRA